MNTKNSRPAKPVSDESSFDRVKMGKRLREVRKYINIPQEVVARNIGIHRTTLSRIENGHRKINATELNKIAEFYKHPISYFTGETSITIEMDRGFAHLARSATKLSEHDRNEFVYLYLGRLGASRGPGATESNRRAKAISRNIRESSCISSSTR